MVNTYLGQLKWDSLLLVSYFQFRILLLETHYMTETRGYLKWKDITIYRDGDYACTFFTSNLFLLPDLSEPANGASSSTSIAAAILFC